MAGSGSLNIKALFLGWLVDTIGTLVSMLAASFAVVTVLEALGSDLGRVQNVLGRSTAVLTINMAAGLLFTMLGGYVAASLAEKEKIRHSLGMGFLSELTGIGLIALFPRTAPLWSDLVSCALVMPAALLGGFLSIALFARRRDRPGHLVECILLTTSVFTFLTAASLIAICLLPGQR